MPFVSEKQRRLFWSAKHSAAVRKKMGISKAAADKMTAHDQGGRIPHQSKHLKKMMGR